MLIVIFPLKCPFCFVLLCVSSEIVWQRIVAKDHFRTLKPSLTEKLEAMYHYYITLMKTDPETARSRLELDQIEVW